MTATVKNTELRVTVFCLSV